MSSKSTMAPVLIAGAIMLALSTGCSRYFAPKDYHDTPAAVYTEPNEAKIPGTAAKISIEDAAPADKGFDAREEIRRSYALNPGANVYVSRVDGPVRVETADIAQAEMLLVRLAKNRDDLQYRQYRVEQSPENLSIYTSSDEHSIFSSINTRRPEIRQRVVLRLPRQVNLEVTRIAGELLVGRLEGRVDLRNIEGRVKVDRAFGQSELYGIKGEADVTFAPLNGRGIEVGGISGNIVMRFEGPVNADLRVRGVSGEFKNELDQVLDKSQTSRSGWKTIQIGTGGPEIEIRGINGNVTLAKAGATGQD